MKKIFISAIGIILFLTTLFLWASGGIQKPGTSEYPAIDYGSGEEVKPTSDKLTVMTWNLAWAYGFGSEGNGYVPKSESEMAERLQKIGETIKNSNADIVLMQEIDFNSSRSHHVDQLKELAKITGLRYAAKVVSWKANYVPFPYWPISNQFGAINSGGAVLSRYPITDNLVTLYPKPESNAWYYNAFYLFRYSEQVNIKFGDKNLMVVDNHLEAYDKQNREEQAQLLSDLVKNLKSDIVIVGGDMNTVPPEATKKSDFPDGTDDYRDDNTLNILRGMSSLKEVIPIEDYTKNESAYFTFPSFAPNRRLDYIFVPIKVNVVSMGVISVGEMSDHLPVRAELDL